LKIFKPDQITNWIAEVIDNIDRGTTAICPFCGIDSIIGDRSGFPIEAAFLQRMRNRWFKFAASHFQKVVRGKK
jgi:hypothetical protein